MASERKCSVLLLALVLAVISSSFALTVVPSTTVPNNTVCVPNTVPSIQLPTEYNTCAQQVCDSRNAANPDKGKTTGEIVTFYGYSLEVYNVTTTDGYILTLHRITGGKISPPAPGKPSVYVHHGMGGSSDNWLFQVGNRNLAFKLADAGYDVWLANCRGTTYSLGHVSLNSSTDVKYWDFSWHEMAMYDVPATINKITEVSGNERMFYIGYSMGTTVFFISMSEMPELNNRIIAAFMLSPVAYNGHANNLMRLIAPTLGTGEQYLLDPILRGRFDQAQEMQRLFNVSLGDFCVSTAMRCGICDNALFYLFGFDAVQMNYTNLPNILQKFPNIISIKTFVHYSQSMNTCEFRQFDYGLVENLIRYKSAIPPSYNLFNITAKTYFFHGDLDNLAVPEDVEFTRRKMRPETVIASIRVNWTLFHHLDFQIAKDADILLYDQVKDLMNGYLPQ